MHQLSRPNNKSECSYQDEQEELFMRHDISRGLRGLVL
jgi:hypothetical protein